MAMMTFEDWQQRIGHNRRRRARLRAEHVKTPGRADIQGLRAVAVLAVIADHVYHWPSGGFVGVDIFFVISGYLITGLLLREYERKRTISYRNFYIRRVKRIIPAALLVLGSTALAAHYLLGGTRAADTAKDCLWAVVFAANWHFAATGTDYFQQGLPPSPVQHFWSLAVEEQFYVVWPWLMLGILVFAGRALKWTLRARVVSVTVAITVITLASFGWALHDTSSNTTVAYFSTFSRAWELGIGAMIAMTGSSIAIKSVAVRTLLAWVGLAGIGVSLFVVPESPGFPAPWGALPVLSAALVIAAGHNSTQPYFWLLTNPVSRYIGDISYSLYLWHFPVAILLLAEYAFGTTRYYIVATVLIVVLSVASYHLVEDPIRKSDWLTVKGEFWVSLRMPALGLAVLATLLGAASVLNNGTNDANASAIADGSFATNSAASPALKCLGAASKNPALGCTQAILGTTVYPSVSNLSEDTAGAFDCWSADSNSAMVTCSYGSKKPDAVHIAIVGDSHAAMLIPGLTPQLEANNWALDTYVGYGCVWIPLGDGSACDKAMAQIQNRLVTGTKYDAVITTAARQKTAKEKDKVSAEMASAWAPVAARGTKIVVVGDNPSVSASELSCVARLGFSVTKSKCGQSRADAVSITDPLVKAATLVPGASLVDMTSYFCDATYCPAVIGNVITYRDTAGHVTGTYSRTLGPYLAAAIKPHV